MVITEAELRDQVRRPRPGAEVRIPDGARLTPAAQDFITQWKLQVITPATAGGTTPPLPDFARESVFPVVRGESPPRCSGCGSPVIDKGDNLTQLNAAHYVPKNHPRIRLRGQVDSLHALVLMAEHQALVAGLDWLALDLATLAAFCRELTSAEYNERPVADLALAGWGMEDIHRATHDPQGVLGVPHATLKGSSAPVSHWLNLCRTGARELELTALDAFHSPHHPYGASINKALNRLSSAFYFLQLRLAQEGQA